MVGSWLATSSCSARLPWDRWEEAVREGLGHGGLGAARWTRLFTGTEPPDHPVGLAHPEARYLKFMLLDKREE
jgi:23S rRNA G2069 N7-methylase RlmK/C1962 C5-methylase RlmI